MTDGILDPEEWGDADRISIGESAHLHLKEYGGYVFIGVDCGDLGKPFAVNFFFVTQEGNALELHTSAQIGERLLVPGEVDPPWIWGLSPDWYANEVRWNQTMAQALMEGGQTRDEAQRRALFDYDGFEFQIRRSKIPGNVWLMRVEIRSSPDYDSPLVFPAGTLVFPSGDWLELTFDPGYGPPRERGTQ